MGYIVHIITVRMCDVETMSLVGYKIGYIVNFVPNPDWHLDSKCLSCNRVVGGNSKSLFNLMEIEQVQQQR
mgnify:CR=1 FL=1